MSARFPVTLASISHPSSSVIKRLLDVPRTTVIPKERPALGVGIAPLSQLLKRLVQVPTPSIGRETARGDRSRWCRLDLLGPRRPRRQPFTRTLLPIPRLHR